jgi:putative phosphoribosyl transferase
MLFADRRDAGRRLAAALADLRGRDVLVLAIPRGGVEVGFEIARALGAPLDVILTHKVGAPGNPEYAIGAVSEIGEVELNEREIRLAGIPRAAVEAEIAHQRAEIERRKALYRGGRPLPPLAGRVVIVTDDGVATGFTIGAALRAVRGAQPAELVLAVPVAPPEALAELAPLADRVVCLATPEPFHAVGLWYQVFDQTSDEQVKALLAAAQP